MSNDIFERFNQVQSALHRPFGYILTNAANDGKIIFMLSRVAYILQTFPSWILYFINAYNLLYLHKTLNLFWFYTIAYVFPAFFLFGLIRHLISPSKFFEIDSNLRLITLYTGLPIWRRKEIISMDDIRVFVSYVQGYVGRATAICYVVMNTGKIHYLIIGYSRFSPDISTKALGYICGKPAVHLVEYPKTWAGSEFYPTRDRSFDVEKMLNAAETLYDPDSGIAPDFSK